MKIILYYFSFLLSGIFGFSYVMSKMNTPEELIAGQWQEVSWKYEKVRTKSDLEQIKNIASADVKDQLGKGLKIHAAETWMFFPNGTLQLSSANSNTTAKWKLKARGNVLELEYDNNTIEHYQITQLSHDSMELQFEPDLKIKGIAKLTFQK